MNKVCKACSRFVANNYGYCPTCWLKMSQEVRDEIEQFNNEKRGRAEPKTTLLNFEEKDKKHKRNKKNNGKRENNNRMYTRILVRGITGV